MTTGREYEQGYATIVAGLKALRELAKRLDLPVTVADLIYHAESRISDEMPPPFYTDDESGPEIASTWGAVSPGDQVKAPNGEWYEVDAWSRIGSQVKALLIVRGGTVPTTQDAGTPVTIRRGPEGRALDVFAAAGMTLERIGR